MVLAPNDLIRPKNRGSKKTVPQIYKSLASWYLKRESGHSAKVPTDAVGRLAYQGFLPLLI